MDGEPLQPGGLARSRAPSTVSYHTDLADEVDVPIPPPDDPQHWTAASSAGPTASASSSGVKRGCDGHDGDEVCGDVEDPDDPQDDGMAGSLETLRVFMLGERRHGAAKYYSWQHPGTCDLCELFSPPRVSAAATARGLRGGWALDIRCEDPVAGSAWDLSEPRAQNKVWKIVRRDKPLMIGFSPECTLFSALQNHRKTDIPEDELARAMACVRFCVDTAEYQIKHGRLFYYEHPLTATSWSMPALDGLRQRKEVENVVLHMCAFDLMAEDQEGSGLAKKPTRVLTNMPSVATALARRCSDDHRLVHLVSGQSGCSVYPGSQ